MLDIKPAVTIDDVAYNPRYFEERYRYFEALPHLKQSGGRRYAVCLTDPADWIALCLHLRGVGASVAPIHPSTPFEAAKRLARRMRCSQLLFQRVDASTALDSGAQDDVGVLVQLSSGTTGEPKCIERTWDSVDCEIKSYNDALAEDRSLQPLLACPITHSYGLISGVLSSLARGTSPVVLANINPKYVIRRAVETSGGLLYASPMLLNVLVRLLPENRTLCAVMTSGAPLPAAWFDEIERRSRRVLQQYGCSELGCVSLNLQARRADEVGMPLRHLHVSAGQSRERPEEIRVRCGERVVGTRDLGHFGARGLCFVARVDDTINVAGVNVYPQEVEEVLLEYPGVDEVVVYKRVDTYAGERVCVKLVARSPLDLGSLRRWCSENLSPFAVPLEIQQIPKIPRLENGKVNRALLAGSTHGSGEPSVTFKPLTP